jgi:hypothetical protein
MEHRPLIDQLTSAMIDKAGENIPDPLAEASNEEVQGLKYRAGETVVDTVSGKEVTVLGGKRAIATVPSAQGGGGEGIPGTTP